MDNGTKDQGVRRLCIRVLNAKYGEVGGYCRPQRRRRHSLWKRGDMGTAKEQLVWPGSLMAKPPKP